MTTEGIEMYVRIPSAYTDGSNLAGPTIRTPDSWLFKDNFTPEWFEYEFRRLNGMTPPNGFRGGSE